MIRINLLPVKELKAELARRRQLLIAGVSVGVTVLLLLGLYLYQSYRVADLRTQLADLRKEIEALNLKVKEVGDLEGKIKEFKGKHRVIDDLNKKKIGPVRIMESLSSATPGSLWLTEFRENSGTILINGLAVDNQAVADFLEALAKSAHFQNVELIETTQSDEKSGSYKKFSIRTAISYQPRTPAGGVKPEDNVATKDGKKR
jgi:type IV pilus assembly protein PilN